MTAVEAAGLAIHHTVAGDGPPLLLVAGTGYAGATWLPALVDRLAQERTVVTYDHRGTGRTGGPTDGLSTRGLARDAVALLDALGIERAAVVGHSMGGRVAQWMALDAPDRVGDLVLAATGPGPMPGAPPPVTGVPAAAAATMIELGYEGYIRRQQATTFFTDDAVAEGHPAVEWLAQAFWASRPSLRDYLAHVVARQQHDTLGLLDHIAHRTLVLVGDLDTHRGGTGSHLEQSRFLAAELPDATLRVLPGLRHGYFWEAPQISADAVLEWLRR